MRTPLWQRPRFEPGGSVNELAFLVFSSRPFPTPEDGTMPMDFADWCPLEHWHPGYTWGYRRRETSADLFRQVEAGAQLALEAPSSGMTPTALTALRASQFGAQIKGTWADAPDLGGVQFGWAMVRWLLASGAEVVFDLQTMRWWSAAEILSRQAEGWVGHAFSLEREVAVSVLPRPDEAWWGIKTLGMAKFGRPDLQLFVASEEADVRAEVRTASLPGWARETVVQLATEWALGAMPRAEHRFGAMAFDLRRGDAENVLELVPR
jgi:hypothetical protein